MNAARIAAAALLAAGAYVMWANAAISAQADADAGQGGMLETAGDVLAETVAAFTGIEIMQSSRYAAALAKPQHAAIIGLLTAAESRHGIPAGLLVRQAWQESRFNPQAVNQVSGAQGLMQFMTPTAREWGVNPFDAASAADGAGRYMAWLYSRLGSWSLALAAYNWGIGNVMRKGMGAAPLETRNYVAQIGADSGIA